MVILEEVDSIETDDTPPQQPPTETQQRLNSSVNTKRKEVLYPFNVKVLNHHA